MTRMPNQFVGVATDQHHKDDSRRIATTRLRPADIGENVAMGQIDQIRNAVQAGNSFINPKALEFIWQFFEQNTSLLTEEEKENWFSEWMKDNTANN